MPLDALNSASAGPSVSSADNAALAEAARPSPLSSERQAEPQTNEHAVRAAAQQIESYLKSVGRTLEFRVDADTNRTIVTVRDKANGEVIRQIPGDEVLELARHLGRGAGGLLNLTV